LAVGDLDIKAGTYSLSPQTWGNTIEVPSNRNIYCENDLGNPSANLPATLNSPVKIVWRGTGVGDWFKVTNNESNIEFYGCEWEGRHGANRTWPVDSFNSDKFVTTNYGSNLSFYGNGVDGWGGLNGWVNIGADANCTNFAQGAVTDTVDISYNRATSCNVRFAEVDYGKHVKVTHNALTDCSENTELLDSDFTGMTVLFDNNTITWQNGSNGGNGANNPFNNGEGTGTAVHGCCAGSNCQVGDFSGVTFSNNTVSGNNSVANYLYEGSSPASASIKGNVCNNSCLNGCQRFANPGNSSPNYWSSLGYCPNGSTE